jgi:WD40 repeat protein
VDIHTQQFVGPEFQSASGVIGLKFGPDGSVLAGFTRANTIVLWDVGSGRQIGSPLIGGSGRIGSIALSPDGSVLASASANEDDVRLWDLASGFDVRRQSQLSNSLSFSPDGTMLAAGGTEPVVRLLELRTGAMVSLPSGSRWINCVAFTPDGKTLAAACDGGVLRFWDITAPEAPTELAPMRREQASVGIIVNGEPLLSLPPAPVRVVAFSSDGHTTATLTTGDVSLWEWPPGVVPAQRLLGRSGAASPATTLAFGPDGHPLATGHADGTVQLWDVASGHPLADSFAAHAAGVQGGVSSLAFSPDGKALATGSNDRTVRLWDLATRRAIGQPLVGHEHVVTVLRSVLMVRFWLRVVATETFGCGMWPRVRCWALRSQAWESPSRVWHSRATAR